jgi:hypothetical protein
MRNADVVSVLASVSLNSEVRSGQTGVFQEQEHFAGCCSAAQAYVDITNATGLSHAGYFGKATTRPLRNQMR